MTPDEEKEWRKFQDHGWRQMHFMRWLATPVFVATLALGFMKHDLSVTQRAGIVQGAMIGLGGVFFSWFLEKLSRLNNKSNDKR
jgi:hypothetical protein